VKAQTKKVLIAGGLVVAAYLIYKWYTGRQQNGPTGQLGTNLNSVAPALIAGSQGPMSGLMYYGGATNIYVSEPISQNATNTQSNTPKGTTVGGWRPPQHVPPTRRKRIVPPIGQTVPFIKGPASVNNG